MNIVYVEAFNIQTFNQVDDKSTFVKSKFYNPPNDVFQHFPVKRKVESIVVNRKTKGYIIDISASVDIREIVKPGSKINKTHEGVIYQINIKTSSFSKVVEFFCFRTKI